MHWFIPYDFSSFLFVTWLVAALLFARGSRQRPVSVARRTSFWGGMGLLYIASFTHFDFYALHQFSVDRIQQVVLHHVVPLLIVLGRPLPVWRSALAVRHRARIIRLLRRSRVWRVTLAIVFSPLLATLLFIAVVIFWLIPRMMTLAMLDVHLYRMMNVSMLASGLIYWSLVLDHRPRPPARMAPGARVLSPLLSMTPQILVGAFITFSHVDLYPIFSICGRAFDTSAMTDQVYGGLITWIPAALIETAAAILALRAWMALSPKTAHRDQGR